MAPSTRTYSTPPSAAWSQSIYVRFRDDYAQRLATADTTRRELAEWRATVASLSTVFELRDISAAVDTDADTTLAALIELHQNGSDLAGAVLLHQMLPKLIKMTACARVQGYNHVVYAERAADTVAAFLTVIATYRGSGRNVAAALALRTLGSITANQDPREIPASDLLDRRPEPSTPAPCEPVHSGSATSLLDWVVERNIVPAADRALIERTYLQNGADLGALAHEIGMVHVLDWAVERRIIPATDRALLDRAYLNDSGASLASLADEIGISYAALRQRLFRAVARLRDAIGEQTPTLEADRGRRREILRTGRPRGQNHRRRQTAA